MVGIKDFEKSEYVNVVVINPRKYNRMWGTDYMLMDGNTFMGGTDDKRYESIIEMFVNIWNGNNC